MAQNIPETAIDNDFHSEAYDIDPDGIYRTIEYFRQDGTLYMKSTLSDSTGTRQYKYVTLSYYDETGLVHLYDIKWELEYDINTTIVSRKRVT
jgi:hypothetical protein